MRHETNPALASNSKIPRIERIGGVALARDAASANEGEEGAEETSQRWGWRSSGRTSGVVRKVDAAREPFDRSAGKRREISGENRPRGGSDISEVAKRQRGETKFVDLRQHDELPGFDCSKTAANVARRQARYPIDDRASEELSSAHPPDQAAKFTLAKSVAVFEKMPPSFSKK